MVFGGLSEQEIEKIASLLEAKKIAYQVQEDQNMNSANEYSMQNNLRHLNSPSISTHILAIEISEESFESMDPETKTALLEFGITNEVPEELEFDENNPNPVEDLQKSHRDGDKRIIGHNLLHQIFVGLGALGIYLLIKYIF